MQTFGGFLLLTAYKKKPAEAGFWLFLLRGISYPRQPRLPMRTVRRLRLRCLVFGTTLSCCLRF